MKFKDYFDKEAARRLGKQMAGATPRFDQDEFVRKATRGLRKLEFNDRVKSFSDALAATLPSDIRKALAIITKSLPAPLPTTDDVTDGWLQWPLGQFIADHGLPHFDASMDAMIELTKRFSSEFAVRPFVQHKPKETFARMLSLTDDPNPHVRRWCSEGVRPRLPWGVTLKALVADPRPIWPIVEALKDDQERYVIRSVGNNLNDIAKDHPSLVIKRCRRWSKKKSRAWLISHALRTLIKDGDRDALAVIGYGPPDKFSATLALSPKRITIGQDVQMTATLKTKGGAQDLIVDYLVHYVRKSGTSPKVFKWTKTTLPARGSIALEKKHRMRPTTIRALYPGEHHVEVQVNGTIVARASFKLA